MKIINKQPSETADISAGRGSALSEFWKLTLSAVVLLIVLYFSVSIIVDLIVSGISFETEAEIFRTLKFSDIRMETHESNEAYDRLSAILEKLKSNENVPPLPYKIILIKEKTPNAFAFPGGTIGITSGISEQLENEIEIAFVIGHELGHFHNRDHLRGFGRAIGFGIAMAVIFQDGLGKNSFTDLVNVILTRKYSQERENKADRYSLELIYDVYGKTEGIDRLFKILLEKNDTPDWAYMFSTHPSPRKRIRNLQTWATEYLSPP